MVYNNHLIIGFHCSDEIKGVLEGQPVSKNHLLDPFKGKDEGLARDSRGAHFVLPTLALLIPKCPQYS